MKHITLNIPTTVDEIKDLYDDLKHSICNDKEDERYVHNKALVIELYNTMLQNMQSNYWSQTSVSELNKNFKNISYKTGNGCKYLLNDILKRLK